MGLSVSANCSTIVFIMLNTILLCIVLHTILIHYSNNYYKQTVSSKRFPMKFVESKYTILSQCQDLAVLPKKDGTI